MTKKGVRPRKSNKWKDKDTENLGRLLKAGLTTKEIAECTGWGVTTVRRYRAAFYPETVDPTCQRNGRLGAKKRNTVAPPPEQPREESSTMRTPHPLFRVPLDLWQAVPSSALGEMVYAQDGDYILIYEAPDRVLQWWLPDGYGDEVAMESLLYRYTPSAEEVARALQGPPGPVGPMGAQGLPGERGPVEHPDTLTETDRLAVMEVTITTIARQVSELMQTVNNIQKEQ